jgi:LacI family transcriptional regulator
VVLLNSAVDGRAYNTLNVDNFGGARAMVRHLLSHGHRRIAIIKGAERNHDAAERLRGYRTALAEAGLTASPELELDGDFTEAAGFAAAERLLALAPRPTAVFAANDSMAIGALSALHEAGIDVPREVAVAGFDDIPIARYVSPPLSSVRVSIGDLGARAVALLMRAVTGEGRGERRQEIVDTELMIRGSCGPMGHAAGGVGLPAAIRVHA